MNALARLRQSLLLFIAARDARERKMLMVGLLAVVLALVYLLLLEPALSGRAQLRKSLPGLHQQVAQMRELADQARELSKSVGAPQNAPPGAPTREGISASLARASLSAKSVSVSGDFIKVELQQVPFDRVVSWLEDLQSASHVAVVDGSVSAQGTPGVVNASLSLRHVGNASE